MHVSTKVQTEAWYYDLKGIQTHSIPTIGKSVPPLILAQVYCPMKDGGLSLPKWSGIPQLPILELTATDFDKTNIKLTKLDILNITNGQILMHHIYNNEPKNLHNVMTEQILNSDFQTTSS